MPVPCTKEEIDNLILASAENEYIYTLFMVAKTTGRRISEYYDVRVMDINFDTGIMKTKVLKRKQKVEKEAILTNEVTMILRRYILKNQMKLEDYVFRKKTKRQIQNLVIKYSKKAGIPHKVTFHNFRHYFVTSLIKKGWSYDRIAKLTGHSTPTTLVHYDHCVASDIKEDALEALKDF